MLASLSCLHQVWSCFCLGFFFFKVSSTPVFVECNYSFNRFSYNKTMQKVQVEKSLGPKTEFWGICCESGKRYSQIVGKRFHISMAALDPTDTSTSAVVSLIVEHDGCQYLLCSLKKDSILQVLLDLYFDKGENITFFLKGHGTVHLSGYYICDKANVVESSKHNKKAPLNKLAEKGGKANFTVSANVESSGEETSDTSDEATVKVSPAKASPVNAKNAKGALNNKSKLSKAIANEAESSEDDSMEEDKDIIIDKPNQKLFLDFPVKKPQGKDLSEKKLQKEEESSSDEDLFDDDDDSEDDEEEEDDEDEDEEEAEVPGMKRGHSAVDSSSDSSDDDSSDNEEIKAGINKIKKQLQQKKLKSGASTPVQNNKGGKKSTPNGGEPDLNSSIGRTPMPKKLKSPSNLNPMEKFIADMKQQSKSPKKDSSKSEEANTSATKTPEKSSNDLNTSAQGESAKKKKKNKKKASENQNTPNKTPAKQQLSHKLAGGIEYEDIRPGNGLVAKKGKLVHVYYTGQLENNKVFDSCQQGQKPFSFKLASGQVIKGWDLGIEGMKVGGKRRLKIPPSMGYANKRTGPIPPNSTLYFTVELKAVS